MSPAISSQHICLHCCVVSGLLVKLGNQNQTFSVCFRGAWLQKHGSACVWSWAHGQRKCINSTSCLSQAFLIYTIISLLNFYFHQNAFPYFFYLYTVAWINYSHILKFYAHAKIFTSSSFQGLHNIPHKQLPYNSVGIGNILTRKKLEFFQGEECLGRVGHGHP